MKIIARLAKKNNKGFSLIECLVAIALIGIIALPVMNSFITSARLNKRSREISYATDVAETLMEGFADKTYSEVQNVVSTLGTASVSGNTFSAINNDIYSDSAHVLKYTASQNGAIAALKAGMNVVSINQINWLYGGPAVTVTMNQINSNDICIEWQEDIEGYFGAALSAVFNADDQNIAVWQDDKAVVTMIGYSNIQYNGQTYDAICTILPAADEFDDIYFPYYVTVNLYDNNDGQHTHMANNDTLVSMTSGIKSK